MRCTAVQRVSKVGFDWIFEIRVGKLMRITCVFNANSARTNRWAVQGSASRMPVELFGKPCDSTSVLEALPGKRDI